LPSAAVDPVLSVVMPTRNQAAFIERSVASVLAQSQDLDGHLELVVADGASTDGTCEILAGLAARYPGQLSWRSEPDRGPADAVNRAVARARAPVIGWLNSDDLYAPGAAARALERLQREPELVMVYGEAEHIDANDRPIGRYPTLPPDEIERAWADGCALCQPTAFFRREVFARLGGLDESLRTAFDFDLWLRLFKAYPGHIGHVSALQARSRLHAGAITMRMRESVAMECIALIHRHVGPAPVHWLLTFADELLRDCPFEIEADAARARLLALAEQARHQLAPGGADEFRSRLEQHAGWRIARPAWAADVSADGWAHRELAIRLRQPDRPYRRLRLRGRHASPRGGPLQLALSTSSQGFVYRHRVPRNGPFEFTVTLPETEPRVTFTLQSDPCFVPRDVSAGSTDSRALAFLIESIDFA
jgi:glycosyltransferase involved in cell wall biosynthesis